MNDQRHENSHEHASSRPLSISLVLPALNEEESIVHSIQAADAALSQLTSDYEILVIDDGSTDATLITAHAAIARFPSVRVIPHPRNLGYGAALRTGFQAATKNYVGFTDADGQFDLTELERLTMLAPEYDLVCGYRIKRQDAWHRRFFSKGYSILTNVLLGTRVRDCDCALKLFRREAIQSLDLDSSGFFINAELLCKARLEDMSLVEVGVTHLPRDYGQSKVSLRHILPVLRSLLPFWWNTIMFPAPANTRVAHAEQDDGVRAWHVALLTLVAIVVLFSRLSYPLIEPDEARYALIAAEMLDSGNLLIPSRAGTYYLDKPPLLYWLTAASYKLFGIHDYAARGVSAVAGLGTWLATYWIGRHIVGRRAALLGSATLLLSIGFVLSSRFLIMDGLLTLFTTFAILGLYMATRGLTLDKTWWLASAAACGLGVMTKGPVALVLTVPVLIAARWLARHGAAIRRADWIWFGLVVTAIAGPWFVAATLREPAFLEYFVWKHHVMRFTSNFAHAQPWWFYIPAIVIGMMPAALLLPVLGYYLLSQTDALRKCRSVEQGYLFLGAAWVLIFFSLSSGKLAPYILPALPLLCLLLGAMLDRAVFAPFADAVLPWIRRRFPIHAARLALLCGITLGVAEMVVDLSDRSRWADGFLLAVASIVLFYLVSRDSFAERPARWVAAGALPLAVMAIAMIGIYPEMAESRSTAQHVARFREQQHDYTTPIVTFMRYEDSLAFYQRETDIRLFDQEDFCELLEYLNTHERVLLVAPSHGIALVRQRLPNSVTLMEQPGSRGHVYLSSSSAKRAEQVTERPTRPTLK